MPIPAILFFALLSGYHSSYCDAHHPATSNGIRAIDFCNFEYPAAGSLDDHSDGPPRLPAHFKLTRGVHEPGKEEEGELITL